MNRDVWTCAVAAAIATFSTAARTDEQAIRQALRSRIPNAEVLAVKKLPYAGLYEVAVRRGGASDADKDVS